MRIVSLVPSLTLTLFDLGLDSTSIVGRTPWCIHPKEGITSVPVIGGTKTPNLGKIAAAQPDLIVMDRDENPKHVYEWCLEQGYEVYVCHVGHPSDVPAVLRELGTLVGRHERGEQMAAELEQTLESLPLPNGRVGLPLIWNEPLMAANGATYAGNMLACMGYDVPVIDPDGTGYPEITESDVIQYGITDLFFSSEPHDFSRQEAERLQERIVKAGGEPVRVHMIDGEALTWMGSYTNTGLQHFLATLH